MTSIFEVHTEPVLHDPVLVVSLEGWVDAGLGATTGAPRPARNRVTSSSRCSQAAGSGRTAGVLAATLATTGAGLRYTITFAPSARITGSVQRTPRRAATLTAASAAVKARAGAMVPPARHGRPARR